MANDTIPFLDLVAPHEELREELLAVFAEVLRTGGFVGGLMVEGFEAGLRELLRHATLRGRG